MPNSSMTNATVAQQVVKQEGNTLTLKYKDGEKTIVVPADIPVVDLVPGSRADLKPGEEGVRPASNKRRRRRLDGRRHSHGSRRYRHRRCENADQLRRRTAFDWRADPKM